MCVKIISGYLWDGTHPIIKRCLDIMHIVANQMSGRFDITYTSNPHYYDYIHNFTLRTKNGTISMCSGGGQRIDFIAEGEYCIKFIDKVEGILSIKNLYESDPYNRDKERIKIDDYDVKFKVEHGRYIMGPIWGNSDHMKEELLVAKERWIFNTDPLSPGQLSRESNLMYILGDMPDDSSDKIYYPEYETKTRNKMKEEGLPLCDDNFYCHRMYVNRSENFLTQHYEISGYNYLREVLNNIKKLSLCSSSEIISYYDNNGKLLIFCVIMRYILSTIVESCYELYIYHPLYPREDCPYENEVQNKIINEINMIIREGIAVALPITTVFSVDKIQLDNPVFIDKEMISIDLKEYNVYFSS